jgi:broad specificity phosphatase PhoE
MIVLVRHGATESNSAGHFLSTADPPLSAQGREQCLQLRASLQKLTLERCLVSPMRRALETREIVAPALPFEIARDLREVDFGSWEGKTLDWLRLHDPDGIARREQDPVSFRPPGGESFYDVAARLDSLIARIQAASNTLIVAHRGTLGVLERRLRGVPLDSRMVEPLEPAEVRILG